MLGASVVDPNGVEGEPGASDGLNLLDMNTVLAGDKQLHQVTGRCAFAAASVSGYEIHVGNTTGPALERPAFHIDGRPEGCISEDGQILGTYLHGVFDNPEACNALLRWAGLNSDRAVDAANLRQESLDRLADAAVPLLEALRR